MKILDEFPQAKSIYNWNEWLDGKVRFLERGIDYKVSTNSMRTYIATITQRREIKIRVRSQTKPVEGIYIQALLNGHHG